MKLGEFEYCLRQAHNNFDAWNDVAGVVAKNSGSYYEILAVIEDCVKIGIFGALGLPIEFDEDGDLIEQGFRPKPLDKAPQVV